MGAKVSQRNPRAIKDRIAAIKPLSVKVGVQGTEANRPHGKVTVVDIAAIHEFGLGNVPVRSWLRGWYDAHEAEGMEKLRSGYRKVIAGELTVEVLGHALGVWAVASIQERISAGITPALKPATIEAKESSTPLIDTGLLRSSVTYVLSTGDILSGVLP